MNQCTQAEDPRIRPTPQLESAHVREALDLPYLWPRRCRGPIFTTHLAYPNSRFRRPYTHLPSFQDHLHLLSRAHDRMFSGGKRPMLE
jgi:hypothetical protein